MAKKKDRDQVICVVAWTAEDFAVVRERRADLGERPELRAVTVGRAAMWLNRATPADVAKARDYAERGTGDGTPMVVFTYPVTEKDPLGRARREVLTDGEQKKKPAQKK